MKYIKINVYIFLFLFPLMVLLTYLMYSISIKLDLYLNELENTVSETNSKRLFYAQVHLDDLIAGGWYSEKLGNSIDQATVLDYFEAEGACIVDYEKFNNKNLAVSVATECAIIVAKAKLLGRINGIVIYENEKIENIINQYPVLQTRFNGIMKNATKIDQLMSDSGIVKITVRINKKQIKKGLEL